MKSGKQLFVIMIMLLVCVCARKSIVLELDLQSDSEYQYKVTTEQKISQTVQGQAVDMQQNVMMQYSYKIKSVDEQGIADIDVVYDRIAFTQQGPLGRLEYKSWEEYEEIPPAAQGFASLIGESFSMKMSSRGEIVEVTGTDKLIDKMLEKIDVPLDEGMKEQIRGNMKNQFGNEALQENMEKMFAFYPKNPVHVGDTWSFEAHLAHGFPMLLKNSYTLKKFEGDNVHIEVNTRIEPNPDNKVIQMGGMEMTYELSGEQKGMMVIDTLTGWMVATDLEQNFDGIVGISGGMMGGPQSMELPMSVMSTVKIELVENQ